MQTKVRKVYPKKLLPPPEVIKKLYERESKKLPNNKILRFLKLFFSEGI